jgi:hypothetical protein
MTIWEKAVLNMQKGTQKVAAAAAVFSDRVKAEIEIARLRIRVDGINSLISEQHRVIGKRVVDLNNRLELPKTTEQLMKDDAIVMAFSEIQAREKDKVEIMMEIDHQSAPFKPGAKNGEDASL